MAQVVQITLGHKISFDYQSWDFSVTVAPVGDDTQAQLFEAAYLELGQQIADYVARDKELASCIDLARAKTMQTAAKTRQALGM